MLTRAVNLPHIVDQDEDDEWCTYAQLQPGVGAHGEGITVPDATVDLREALTLLVSVFGIPCALKGT